MMLDKTMKLEFVITDSYDGCIGTCEYNSHTQKIGFLQGIYGSFTGGCRQYYRDFFAHQHLGTAAPALGQRQFMRVVLRLGYLFEAKRRAGRRWVVACTVFSGFGTS
jgi:hypothetical protein